MTRGVKRDSPRDLRERIARSKQNVREQQAKIRQLRAEIKKIQHVIEVERLLQASTQEKLNRLSSKGEESS